MSLAHHNTKRAGLKPADASETQLANNKGILILMILDVGRNNMCVGLALEEPHDISQTTEICD